MGGVNFGGTSRTGEVTPDLKTRGARLRLAMRVRGVNKLSVLAATIGTSESAVCRWCNNENMTLDNIVRVCVSLNVSADWLLLGRGHMDMHQSGTVSLLPHLYQLIMPMAPNMREQVAGILRMLATELS